MRETVLVAFAERDEGGFGLAGGEKFLRRACVAAVMTNLEHIYIGDGG